MTEEQFTDWIATKPTQEDVVATIIRENLEWVPIDSKGHHAEKCEIGDKDHEHSVLLRCLKSNVNIKPFFPYGFF